MWSHLISEDVKARLEQLALPFNRLGVDPYGISRKHLALFYSFLEFFYKHYFRVRCFGIGNIPATGPAMLVGNHSGGIPADGGMIIASLFFDANPPRHAHGMIAKFVFQWPFIAPWFSRVGQFPGLPEHATRILRDGRLLFVFPEGTRGTGKLYKHRYNLVRFGTGFMRIALQTRTPIIPLAFIGAEEALPTMFHARRLAKLVGTPYWPVPPYLIPFPLPLKCEIHYGEPLLFNGTGNEADHVIEEYVDQVRKQINRLLVHGCTVHQQRRAGALWELDNRSE